MAEQTGIEWTDSTWTPIRARLTDAKTGNVRVGWHCEHASEGCRNCYAEGMNNRLGTGLDYKPGHLRPKTGDPRVTVFLDEKMLLAPLKWKKPRKIFVCSMTDLFADFVTDEMIDRVFAVMALCPQHVFQVLTKRSARMRAYLNAKWGRRVARIIVDWLVEGRIKMTKNWPVMTVGDFDDPDDIVIPKTLPNVWLGVSVEDQTRADERIPNLLATPAAVRWISAEPLLGPVDLRHVKCEPDPHGEHDWTFDALMTGSSNEFRDGSYWMDGDGPHRETKIDWVVSGGESGPNARPAHPDWFRALRDQCAAAGVPYLHKQNGEFIALETDADWDATDWDKPGRDHLVSHNAAHDMNYYRVGKKRAGRLLDGVLHEGWPG